MNVAGVGYSIRHVISSDIQSQTLVAYLQLLAAWIFQWAFGWLPSVARVLDCSLQLFTLESDGSIFCRDCGGPYIFHFCV